MQEKGKREKQQTRATQALGPKIGRRGGGWGERNCHRTTWYCLCAITMVRTCDVCGVSAHGHRIGSQSPGQVCACVLRTWADSRPSSKLSVLDMGAGRRYMHKQDVSALEPPRFAPRCCVQSILCCPSASHPGWNDPPAMHSPDCQSHQSQCAYTFCARLCLSVCVCVCLCVCVSVCVSVCLCLCLS